MLKSFEDISSPIPLRKPVLLDFIVIDKKFSLNPIEEETTGDNKTEKEKNQNDLVKIYPNNNCLQKINNNISSIANIVISNDDILQEHKFLNLNTISNLFPFGKENYQPQKKPIFSCNKRFHDNNDNKILGTYCNTPEDSAKNIEIKKNGKGKSKKPLYKKHDKMEKDNIVRKINVHYCNFLTNFINEITQKIIIDESYKTENAEEILHMKDYLLNNIDYKFKSNIKKEFMEETENMAIKDIISPNEKFCELHSIKNKNEQIMERLEKKNNPILNKILNQKYLYYFNEVYYPSERTIALEEENESLNFHLSDDTKLFSDLILKNEDNNKYILKLKRVVMQKFSKSRYMFKIKK